jgi:hypothetical protein
MAQYGMLIDPDAPYSLPFVQRSEPTVLPYLQR